MSRRTPITFFKRLLEQPLWLSVWVGWMGLINMASVVFVRHPVGRWTLLAFVVAFALMVGLYVLNGFNRLLGLAHVVAWTPLVVYLATRLEEVRGTGLLGTWVIALLATNGLSLVVDVVDVVRYWRGERT